MQSAIVLMPGPQDAAASAIFLIRLNVEDRPQPGYFCHDAGLTARSGRLFCAYVRVCRATVGESSYDDASR